jgi:hypothetical protein
LSQLSRSLKKALPLLPQGKFSGFQPPSLTNPELLNAVQDRQENHIVPLGFCVRNIAPSHAAELLREGYMVAWFHHPPNNGSDKGIIDSGFGVPGLLSEKSKDLIPVFLELLFIEHGINDASQEHGTKGHKQLFGNRVHFFFSFLKSFLRNW